MAGHGGVKGKVASMPQFLQRDKDSLGLLFNNDGHPTNLKDVFLSKLPEKFLFDVTYFTRRYNGFENDSANWFSYLALVDDACGRTHWHEGKEHEFHYISYHTGTFKEKMFKLMEGAKSFIDVGCGGGDKLAIVKHNWPHVKVHGVEHDPTMAIWASQYADKVFCMDAMGIDYSYYDVIYAYWPISNVDKMDALLRRIFSQAKRQAQIEIVGYSVNKVLEEHFKKRKT